MSKWLIHVVLIGVVLLASGSLKAQSEALKTFDAFWELFNEQYASFEEKGIDWDAKQVFRNRITANTSDEELFDILAEMIKPLNDAHTTLKADEINKRMSASRPSRIMQELSSLPGKDRRPLFSKMTEQTLIRSGFDSIRELGPTFRGEKLFSYSRSENIGYLRFFRSFSTPTKMVGVSLDSQLDQIFEYFSEINALIIDVRFNIGGDDAFSKRIVSRLIEDEMVGFKKQTRKNGSFGKLKDITVEPCDGEPFLSPVVLLTNDKTVSAADVLALMMDQLPQVTIIGERSNGSYSDLYAKRLPNGWKVTLSNQRYYSTDMKNYEGTGTPVDLEIKNTIEDVENENDSVLLGALDAIEIY